MQRFYPPASDTRGQLYRVNVQSSKTLILERYASTDIRESMLAARQYDCLAEGRTYERKTRFFNRATQETSLDLYQQFLPTTMNQLKSPRNRIDYNRHSMQLTNKPRKQDDQHFTPRKFAFAKKVRSFPHSSPDRFPKQFPPGKPSQQQHSNTLNRSNLSRVDSLNECPKLYSQNSMLASSLSLSSESRSSSSDDNLANHSPIHQLDTSSPDHFEYFRMFEDASVTDMPGPSFSGANYRSESCQVGYETFEDLNMNLLKFDLLDDISSSRQSPVREERGPGAQGDILNESSR